MKIIYFTDADDPIDIRQDNWKKTSHGGTAARRARREMNENEIGNIVVDTAFYIHRNLGAGLLESIYPIPLSSSVPVVPLCLRAGSSMRVLDRKEETAENK